MVIESLSHRPRRHLDFRSLQEVFSGRVFRKRSVRASMGTRFIMTCTSRLLPGRRRNRIGYKFISQILGCLKVDELHTYE